jgi:hypothetical protein
MTIDKNRLRQLFGLEDLRISPRSASVVRHDGYIVEHLRLDIAGRGEVRGLLTRPADGEGSRRPAILFGHSHGGRYDIGASELLVGREYLLDPPGPALARAGYVTLCIDMPVFGERATVSESSAAKALLWHGKSLFGQMLSDHAAALTYLASRDDVDAARIGAFGISMGCTLSYWLAAVDTRIAATAHLCCFADLRKMIEMGNHDGHGIYLTVPGLLAETDAGEIAGLIAPRPQLICIGEADALTPLPAFEIAYAQAKAAYAAAGVPERLRVVREPGIGHQETQLMRDATLSFFSEAL